MMGADSRTSTGSYVANRVTDKITQLADRIYICRSGSAADTQNLSRYVQVGREACSSTGGAGVVGHGVGRGGQRGAVWQQSAMHRHSCSVRLVPRGASQTARAKRPAGAGAGVSAPAAIGASGRAPPHRPPSLPSPAGACQQLSSLSAPLAPAGGCGPRLRLPAVAPGAAPHGAGDPGLTRPTNALHPPGCVPAVDRWGADPYVTDLDQPSSGVHSMLSILLAGCLQWIAGGGPRRDSAIQCCPSRVVHPMPSILAACPAVVPGAAPHGAGDGPRREDGGPPGAADGLPEQGPAAGGCCWEVPWWLGCWVSVVGWWMGVLG